MKNNILLICLLLGSSILLVNCSPSSEKQAGNNEKEMLRDIKKEKSETVRDLKSLRDDINSKLDKVSSKIEVAKDDGARNELEAVKTILLDNSSKVEVALYEIDKSSDDSWDDVHQSAINTLNDVRVACEALSERVDNALENAKG